MGIMKLAHGHSSGVLMGAVLAVAVMTGCGGETAQPETTKPEGELGEAQDAFVISGLFSTGVDGQGTPLAGGAADPHFSGGVVISSPNGLWVGNTATSKWISLGSYAASYTLSTTFTVSGTGASVSGSWACDNDCTMKLNGVQVATFNTYATWSSFTISSGFVQGQNTLALSVNDYGAPTGIHVKFSGSFLGCALDSQCTAAQYCNGGTAPGACVSKLANGVAIPTVSGHTPALDGTCTTAAAAAVCASGACDAGDNACGYQDGHGPCTTADGAVVCRSGVCSPHAGVCMPAGGCAADADCAADQWCDTPSFTCTSKLPNGQAVPSVPGHTPALDGTCTTAAAAAVCASGACDAGDNACGYQDGHGPCTTTDGAVVCRSGACGVNGLCMPAGGCNVDPDCDGSSYCDTGANACVAKLPNGASIPTVAGHTPPVDGVCSPDVAAVVCLSLVCDPRDNRCGYADGGGPCTTTDGAVVCRSTHCAAAGEAQSTCVECVEDADCSGHVGEPACDPASGRCLECHGDAQCAEDHWCDSAEGAAGACQPKRPTGQPCTRSGQCRSGVCEDDRCGDVFASGGGVRCSTPAGGAGDAGSFGVASALAGLCLALRRRRVVQPELHARRSALALDA